MRHRLLHHRGLIAALVAVAALASPWASAARADVAQVTVVSPGGSQQTLALEALTGSKDVVGRGYALRSAVGETTETVTGFSLAAILAAAGADTYGFSYLEVGRPAGGAVLLSRDQALSTDGPPVVYATAGGTGFLRPSAGADDLNASDSFTAPQGLSVVLRKGSPLRVRATASTRRTKPGSPVHFEAIVDRAGSGESLTYSWYFDDGHSSASPTASHSFAKPGSYDVVLGVTSGGNEAGSSAVVTIQVGAPPAGPDRKGGGHNHDASAPDHGAASGPSDGAGTGGSGSETAAQGSTPAESSSSTHPRFQKHESRAKGTTDEGELVSGLLLDPNAPSAAPSPAQAAARSGHLEGGSGDGGGVPAVAWGLLGTFGLLGLGALTEAGGLAALRLRKGSLA